MSFEEENSTTCPRCGAVVPSGNAYCGNCGASVPRAPLFSSDRGVEPISTRQQRPPPPPRYDRKLSTIERIFKVFFSPREAMEDIGQAPDYTGVIIVFALWTIVTAISIALALPKVQFTGPDSELLNSMVASAAWGGVVLVPVVLIVRWLVKTYLIRHMTDSNLWDFETAASVTGYAYLPNVLFAFIGMILSWMLLPSIVISTVDPTLALIQLEQFAAQTLWISVGLSSILALLALFWKSKLGSYGAYAGTHRNYSEGSAFGTFMIVGFIGFIIDFVASFL